MQVIKQMPKIELHAHFSGCMRESTLVELLKQKEGDQTDLTFLTDSTLDGAFTIFKKINSLNMNLDIIRRVIREVLEDFALDNVVYLEIRATPKSGPNFKKLDYIMVILEEIIQSESLITSRLILTIDRAKGLEDAQETVQLFDLIPKEFQHYIVGVDLAGYPKAPLMFKEYQQIFEQLRQKGLRVTLHLGEVDSEKSLQEIDDALNWKPNRIGHLIFYSPEQLKLIQELKIPVEICYTSNMCTCEKQKQDDHHFSELFQKGVQVVICTDDTLLCRVNLSEELFKIQNIFQLSFENMISLQEMAIKSIFDDSKKEELFGVLKKYMNQQL